MARASVESRNRMTMKVTLLEPAFNGRGLVRLYGFKVLPYGLLQLASVTPPGVEVEVLDEKVEPLPETLETDLLGISVFTTANAPRAYELAAHYRSQGIPIVMGGVHPSALPQEALHFADSVVLGEGEVVWPEVLGDFQQGALKPLYPAPLPDLAELPSRHPWHLLKTERYPAPTVLQTTRGCPIGCEFCSVTSFNGKKMRHKRLDQFSRNSRSWPPSSEASIPGWRIRSSSSTIPSGPTSASTKP